MWHADVLHRERIADLEQKLSDSLRYTESDAELSSLRTRAHLAEEIALWLEKPGVMHPLFTGWLEKYRKVMG
jgi:hypothetical protein